MILIPILQTKKLRPKKIRGPASVDGDSHQHLGHIFLRDESFPRPLDQSLSVSVHQARLQGGKQEKGPCVGV